MALLFTPIFTISRKNSHQKEYIPICIILPIDTRCSVDFKLNREIPQIKINTEIRATTTSMEYKSTNNEPISSIT